MSGNVDKAVGELFRELERRFQKVADDTQKKVEDEVEVLSLIADLKVRATQGNILKVTDRCIALGKLRGRTDAYDEAARAMGILAEKYEARHVERTTVVF